MDFQASDPQPDFAKIAQGFDIAGFKIERL
jgi:hypothetical protein